MTSEREAVARAQAEADRTGATWAVGPFGEPPEWPAAHPWGRHCEGECRRIDPAPAKGAAEDEAARRAYRHPGTTPTYQPSWLTREVALWDEINAYAKACGADTSDRTAGTTRANAVVAVNRALDRLCGVQATPPAPLARDMTLRQYLAAHAPDYVGKDPDAMAAWPWAYADAVLAAEGNKEE